MEHSPLPDWKDEKALCDLFLKYDERNCEFKFEPVAARNDNVIPPPSSLLGLSQIRNL